MAQPVNLQRGTRHSGLAPGLGSNSDIKMLGNSVLPSSNLQPGSLTFGSCPAFSFADRQALAVLWKTCCALKDVVHFEGAAQTADELMRTLRPALLYRRDSFLQKQILCRMEEKNYKGINGKPRGLQCYHGTKHLGNGWE